MLYGMIRSLGEAGTGKSCLLHHFTHNTCTTIRAPLHPTVTNELPFYCVDKAHSQHTIGVEFSSRTIKLGEKRIKLQVCTYHRVSPSTSDSTTIQLWDTAGQERFRSVTQYDNSKVKSLRDDLSLCF
jgi:GTPase SAR1 family protein